MKIYQFTIDHARKIGNELGVDWERIDIHEFLRGMNVELEHGLVNAKTNITNDNDLMTGKIALAHLNEVPDYYSKLEKIENQPVLATDLSHYYGNTVRQIFFVAAAIMLVGLPFVKDALAIPAIFSVVAILTLDFFAALVNPRQAWINWANTLTSVVALIIFEFFAIKAFTSGNAFFFVLNQVLALMFFVALYFNTKTVRHMIVK